MANLRILVPDGTTNYIKNPSARYDTTGWNAVGSTVTRTLDYARFGVASLKVVTNGAALYEGVFYRVSTLSGISETITISVYLRGTGSVRLRLIDNPFGQERFSPSLTLRADRWMRLEVTGSSTGSNDMRLYVETDEVKAVTFYVDGAQMERKPYATTYCDGDQEGCRWNIVAHNSHSIRDPYTRAGGRWVELAGDARREKNLYMTVVGGLGLPPITNNTQSFSDAPGSYYQNTKVLARPFTLTFHAMHEHKEIDCDPVTLAHLHELRQVLIDIIKPDRTRGGEEFTLEYTDGDKPLYLKARYDGGLEGDWDIRNEWITSFPVRLLAVSPYFSEDDQEVTSLDFQDWPYTNQVLSRVDGAWSNMNFGFNSTVRDMALGARGEIIAVGDFTRANSDVTAIDPLIPANRIAYWDGEKWNQYGDGANDSIRAVAVAPNGYVYVTGLFTSIGGVAANRVAYWDGAAWNAMGSGLNNSGYGIAVAPNGDVYVVGSFLTAGGVLAHRAARWDGGTWHSMGTYGGLNEEAYTVAIEPDGSKVYVGGFFTDETGFLAAQLLRVAQYDVATNEWEAMGDGFNSIVRRIKISPSGTIYAAGDFITSGFQAANYTAYWNGANWLPLGSGLDGAVYGMSISSVGNVLVGGVFTQAGDAAANSVAEWNGSTWTNSDIVASNSPLAVLHDKSDNIYVAANTPVSTSAVTLVENTGTTETNPKIYISGPGTLRYLENYTAKKRAFFDLDILSGEEVFIDFGRGRVESNVRGNLSYSVLPGSDLRAFTLIPGENKILALIVNDVGARMTLNYIPKHWSVDATQSAEAL